MFIHFLFVLRFILTKINDFFLKSGFNQFQTTQNGTPQSGFNQFQTTQKKKSHSENQIRDPGIPGSPIFNKKQTRDFHIPFAFVPLRHRKRTEQSRIHSRRAGKMLFVCSRRRILEMNSSYLIDTVTFHQNTPFDTSLYES